MHPTFKKGFSGKTIFKQINFTVLAIYYTFSKATCFLRKIFLQLSKSDKEFLEFKMHHNLQFGKMWKKVHLKFKVIW